MLFTADIANYSLATVIDEELTNSVVGLLTVALSFS